MKLKLYLIANGITIGELANVLGISRQAMSLKIHNKIPFKEEEMKIIYKYLKAKDSNLKIEDIFF